MKMIQFLRELFELARAGKKMFVVLFFLTLIGTLAAIPGPFAFAWIIERAQADLQMKDLMIFVGITVGFQLLQAVVGILRVRLNKRFSLDAANRLRDNFFRTSATHAIQLFPELQRRRSGKLIPE